MSPLKLIVLFLTASLLQTFQLWSQEAMPVDLDFELKKLEKLRDFESDIMISRQYRRGANLIYDCESQHFACVSLEGFERCTQKRAEDLQKKKIDLRCTPFKAFSTVEECSSEQLRVIEGLFKKDFCLNLNEQQLFEL